MKILRPGSPPAFRRRPQAARGRGAKRAVHEPAAHSASPLPCAIRSNVGSPLTWPALAAPRFPHCHREWKWSNHPRRCLVERTPNQPYLVAPGKHTVQKLPDIKMTSSHTLNAVGRIERWPIAGSFTISRGAKTEAVTVVAEVSRGGHTGRGECVPYPRYGETPEATLAALEAMQEPLSRGLDRAGSAGGDACRRRPQCAGLRAGGPRGQDWRQARLGPARAPRAQGLHHRLHDLARNPRGMAAATAKAAHRPLLKIKLGGDGDGDADRRSPPGRARLRAHRRCQRGLDAGQSRAEPDGLRGSRRHPGGAAAAGGAGRGARHIRRPIAVCADESVHDRASLERPARALRCRQHQARQDRRPDGGAGDGGRRARAGI